MKTVLSLVVELKNQANGLQVRLCGSKSDHIGPGSENNEQEMSSTQYRIWRVVETAEVSVMKFWKTLSVLCQKVNWEQGQVSNFGNRNGSEDLKSSDKRLSVVGNILTQRVRFYQYLIISINTYILYMCIYGCKCIHIIIIIF